MAVIMRGLYKCFRSIFYTALPKNNIHLGIATPYKLNLGEDDKEANYKYELSFNPNEWKHVEKLLPLKLVPNVTKKSEYPSGWKPQTEEIKNHPYYIRRSKNHMLPVYLINKNRGMNKFTIVRHIHGDLWKLHEELHKHLEETLKKPIVSCVMEGNANIRFKGDYVYYCEQFLLEKGF